MNEKENNTYKRRYYKYSLEKSRREFEEALTNRPLHMRKRIRFVDVDVIIRSICMDHARIEKKVYNSYTKYIVHLDENWDLLNELYDRLHDFQVKLIINDGYLEDTNKDLYLEIGKCYINQADFEYVAKKRS